MFNEISYYLLLLVAAVAYHFAPRRASAWILAFSGIAFYTYYAGGAVVLLLLLTVGSWLALFGKAASESPQGRARRLALATVVVSTAVLVLIKYGPFLLSTVGEHYERGFAVPLAISFFTFEFIHVAVERWRGTLARVPFDRYLAFIFFFPTMVAGPIKRYGDFEPCLEKREFTARDFGEGVFRILLGLFKKLVVADNLVYVIDEIGRPHEGKNPALFVLAVVLYGFRIFLDFAGYSDIAIGSARLFGIRVPENFLYPYRQTNIAHFWRHWHMSLTSWLTDYVYIPLGGNRKGERRQMGNLFAVMLVSGIWHGAAWNFVLWGVWHGILLTIHRLYERHVVSRMPVGLKSGFPVRAASYVLTMACVWFGWMLFMWPIGDSGILLGMLWNRVAK